MTTRPTRTGATASTTSRCRAEFGKDKLRAAVPRKRAYLKFGFDIGAIFYYEIVIEFMNVRQQTNEPDISYDDETNDKFL